jgi:hypothetical protein
MSDIQYLSDLDEEERKMIAMGLMLVRDVLAQRKGTDWVEATLPIVELIVKCGLEEEWGHVCTELPPTVTMIKQ